MWVGIQTALALGPRRGEGGTTRHTHTCQRHWHLERVVFLRGGVEHGVEGGGAALAVPGVVMEVQA
jgi:hypothetical protein